MLRVLVCCGLVAAAFAANAAKVRFDLPAGEARPMLRQFATQAQREIVFPVESVDGVRTHAVAGEMTPQEAVDRMLAGTNLRPWPILNPGPLPSSEWHSQTSSGRRQRPQAIARQQTRLRNRSPPTLIISSNCRRSS